jgi:hypothetical protein
VQVVAAAQGLAFGGGVRVSVPDLAVELDRVGPAVRVVVPDPFPPGVAVEWAPEASGFHDPSPALVDEVGFAVGASPAQIQQRKHVAQVADVGVPGTVDLIDADTDGLLGVHAFRHPPRMRVAERFPGRPLQRGDLVLVGALPAGEPFRPVRIQGVQRDRNEPVRGVDRVRTEISGGHGPDRDTGPRRVLTESGEVRVDRFRFPPGVGEIGDVERRDDAVAGQ